MTRGTDLIAKERQRQIDVEGYSPEHDVAHANDALAWAAACYAAPETVYRLLEVDLSDGDGEHRGVRWWEPWPRTWRREIYLEPTPEQRIRELVKAGALIAAEIDRLRSSEGGCVYREALDELDRVQPDDFKAGQGHLSPAFREVDFRAAFGHVVNVVNRVLHDTDENGRPL